MKWVYSVIFELKKKHEQFTNHDKIAHEKKQDFKKNDLLHTRNMTNEQMQTHQMKFGYEMCECLKNTLNIFYVEPVYSKTKKKRSGVYVCVYVRSTS